jgi:hypothetical protein
MNPATKNNNGFKNRQESAPVRSRKTTGTEPNSEDMGKSLAESIVWIGTAIPRLLHWTTKGGAPIVAGLFGAYAFLVCVESYWRALPNLRDSIENLDPVRMVQIQEANPPFIPKPGIDDGASLANAPYALMSPDFYICLMIALFVQVIESNIQRGKTPEQAKSDFEKVKHFKTEPLPEGAIKLVGVKQREYNDSGLAPVKRNAGLTVAAYVVDYGAAIATFGSGILSGLGGFFVGSLWAYIAIYAPETCWGWMSDRLEEQKQERDREEKAKQKQK